MGALRLEGLSEVSDILRSGVYVLAKNGVVIYVGKSKSVYARLYAHRTTAARKAKGKEIPSWLPAKGFVFDQIFVQPCHVDQLDELERAMINLYKPRYNKGLKTAEYVRQERNLRIGNTVVTLNKQADDFVRRV